MTDKKQSDNLGQFFQFNSSKTVVMTLHTTFRKISAWFQNQIVYFVLAYSLIVWNCNYLFLYLNFTSCGNLDDLKGKSSKFLKKQFSKFT